VGAPVRAQDDTPEGMGSVTSDQLITQGYRLKKTVKKPNQRRWEYYVKGDQTYVCDSGLYDTMGCRLAD
jgi:hypothetical protein